MINIIDDSLLQEALICREFSKLGTKTVWDALGDTSGYTVIGAGIASLQQTSITNRIRSITSTQVAAL